MLFIALIRWQHFFAVSIRFNFSVMYGSSCQKTSTQVQVVENASRNVICFKIMASLPAFNLATIILKISALLDCV